jgi:tetratricopeptide (TPR) repeat protein
MIDPTNKVIADDAREEQIDSREDRSALVLSPYARRRFASRELLLVALLFVCLGLAAGVARWLELRRPTQYEVSQVSEELYVTPNAAREMSLAFNGLAADWYWLRTLQYVGRKSTAYEGQIQLDDLRALNLKILAPLLDNTTTLDPQFMAAYEYGAVVLPAVDTDAAVKLINKGIAANPDAWRLYSYLGYIYWQQNRFKEASDAYAAGSRVAGAPAWMGALAAQMSVKGGSRETARAIYETMLRTTEDEHARKLAADRLAQLQSLDEMDALRRVLSTYQERTSGRCPATWREVAPAVHAARFRQDASGAPLDPSDVPYKLINDRCDVELDERSTVLHNY